MEEILEKHWSKFLLNLGQSYKPLSPRAKEFILLAMEEYKSKPN